MDSVLEMYTVRHTIRDLVCLPPRFWEYMVICPVNAHDDDDFTNGEWLEKDT